MALKINQNIMSLLTQRNLARVTEKMERSYERVSSGERLNRSADDPAGMATSETLRYEIQGLRQNQQNVAGAYSLVGTAESGLSSMGEMLQRARELAVQAGNDTLQQSNRQSIQSELNQLIEEINRTATTARYGDRLLLGGQFTNTRIQIGTGSAETLLLSLGDYRTNTLGSYAQLVSTQPVSTVPITAGSLSISGVAVPPSLTDGVSIFSATASAKAKAAAINQVESRTGVHAEALPTTQTGVGGISAVNIDGTLSTFVINGVNIGAVTVSTGDASGSLVNRINAVTAQTGVTASVNTSGRLVLTAADGRNVNIRTTGSIADELGMIAGNGNINLNVTGQIRLSSPQSFTLNDPAALLGIPGSPVTANLDPATALDNLSVADSQAAARALSTIDAALSQVNAGRSGLGAVSNRLEGMADTLAGRVENLSATDSRIRDTDYAFETAQLAQTQILQEAALSLLAQANITPRRALELLQG